MLYGHYVLSSAASVTNIQDTSRYCTASYQEPATTAFMDPPTQMQFNTYPVGMMFIQRHQASHAFYLCPDSNKI